jgi:RNA polymerase sigma factor (sigma-70 family)
MDELQSLVGKCRDHDRRAQFELYKMWFPELMRMATRYKKNREDAAALVNTAFFKAFTNIEKYESHVPFEAWLRQIMKNTIIDEYRIPESPSEFPGGEGEEVIYSEEAVDYNLVEKEMSAEEAERILYRLEESERVVFNMYEMDGYSHKEIAEAIGISERTSKRYLASARSNLQQMLKGILNSVLVLL